MTPQERNLIATEAFLRRASMINAPFMVKGSIITRQYLDNPKIRYIGDLDWIYLEKIDDTAQANLIFSKWVIQVTEMSVVDNVQFKSFRQNDFWRGIDYSMDDDFPTVNTDLEYTLDGETHVLSMDISFNLDTLFPSRSLMYKPQAGEDFLLKNTVPLSLQISWKLHQCLVNPRVKDVYDLIHLFYHEEYNRDIFDQVVKALLYECGHDNVPVGRLRLFVNGTIHQYFSYNRERGGESKEINYLTHLFPAFSYLDVKQLKIFTSDLKYSNLASLFLDFEETLLSSGFTEDFIDSIS